MFYWIQADKQYKQFVQNRVDEIRKLTEVKNWRHCPGIENPADIGSRGCLPTELVTKKMWWEGPSWLKESPTQELTRVVSQQACRMTAHKKQIQENHTNGTVLVNATQETVSQRNAGLSEVIDCEQYSNCARLFRVTGLVLKVTCILKTRRKPNDDTEPRSLSEQDIEKARNAWIRETQRTIEPQASLTDNENILRCRGRLANAPLSLETRFPILLPRENHISKLIVEECHHGGVKETLETPNYEANFGSRKGDSSSRRPYTGASLAGDWKEHHSSRQDMQTFLKLE